MALKDDLRKIVHALVERCDDKTCLYIHQLRQSLLLLGNLDSVHNPWRNSHNSTLRVILPLRQSELGTLFHQSQLDSIHELVTDQDGITLHARSKESSTHRDYTTARDLYRICRRNGSYCILLG